MIVALGSTTGRPIAPLGAYPAAAVQMDLFKHQYFELQLPTNQLLERIVGHGVITRRVCHEWPLSCVEVVTFANGTTKYSKTTAPPSREVEVYESLTSPILVPYTVVARSESSTTLLLDSFDGQRMQPEIITQLGFEVVLRQLEEKLSTLVGTPPVFVDLSLLDNVRANMSAMIGRLERLYGAGAPYPIDRTLLDVGITLARARAVEDALIEEARYSNGDLSAANILIGDDQMRIIDWQFPRIASLRVEAVNLLESLGINPRVHLRDEDIAASILCKIRWLTECAEVWFSSYGYCDEVTGLLSSLGALEL